MQNRADIFAAFALTFWVKLLGGKLRRSVMVEGDEERELTMTIRGPAWTAIEISIRRDCATNYIGYMTDFNNPRKASKELMIKIAKSSVAAIMR